MKNKKEFLGVILSVLVCAFLVFLGVYATTTVGNDVSIGGDLTITDDLTITGNGLNFGNGASISNVAGGADLLTITEDLVSIVGKASVSSDLYVTDDLIIAGNGLNFGNGASISNVAGGDDLLTITEDLVSIVGKASVSSDFNVSGNSTFAHASVSDDLSINAAHILSGTASPSQTNCPCDIGDIYIKTGAAGIDSILNICDATNTWTTASLSW